MHSILSGRTGKHRASAFVVILSAAVVVGVATSASAAPFLAWSHVVLPSGYSQWTISFDGNDGQALASAFDLKFTGDIVHTLAFGSLAVDNFQGAQGFDGPSYDKEEDTWIAAGAGTIWTVALPSTFIENNGGAGGIAHLPAGPVTSGTASYASFGTAGGATQGPGATPIAQIVIVPNQRYLSPVHITGTISRGASITPINVVFGTAYPEPSSGLLMMIGMLGAWVTARHRQRR